MSRSVAQNKLGRRIAQRLSQKCHALTSIINTHTPDTEEKVLVRVEVFYNNSRTYTVSEQR